VSICQKLWYEEYLGHSSLTLKANRCDGDAFLLLDLEQTCSATNWGCALEDDFPKQLPTHPFSRSFSSRPVVLV
jgi:hypothetical protein